MPNGWKVSSDLYEQFKQWYQEKYGWLKAQFVPRNEPGLEENIYYKTFLREIGMLAPEAPTRYIETPGAGRWPTTAMYERPAGPEMPLEVARRWETRLEAQPWLTTGETEEEYYARQPWQKMGVTEQAFLRKQWGFPTEEELRREAEQEERARQITPYQEWMIEARRAEMEASNLERQVDWYKQQLDLAQRRAQQRTQARQQTWERRQTPQGWMTNEERRQRILLWEEDREQLLSALDPHRDWITRYKIETQRNPWISRREEMEGMKLRGVTLGAERPREPTPTVPATPSWLREMYPEKLGERISKIPVAPLGGQQWMRMPETQRQRWMSFAEYGGAEPMDLLSQMAMMRPQQPVIPRRWAAPRQWG